MALPLEVVELIELARNEAWADIYRAAPRELASELGLGVRWFGSALAVVASGFNAPLLNNVSGLGVAEEADEETVSAIGRLYQEVGTTHYSVSLSPVAKPSDLTRWLEAGGLHSRGSGAKLYRGTEPPAAISTDLRVEGIGVEHADDFGAVFVEAFGLPNALSPWARAFVGRPSWHHYLAFDGEKAVACGSLFVWNGVGWLGNGGTIPSHRRRGAQGVIISERVREGIRAGCDWLTSETGLDTPESPNHSYRNMVRNGFSLAYSPVAFQPKDPSG